MIKSELSLVIHLCGATTEVSSSFTSNTCAAYPYNA